MEIIKKSIVLFIMALILTTNPFQSFGAVKSTPVVKIVKIETQLETQKVNVPMKLPQKVTVLLSNGKKEIVDVKWLDKPSYQKPGTYSLRLYIAKYKDTRKMSFTVIQSYTPPKIVAKKEEPLYLKVEDHYETPFRDALFVDSFWDHFEYNRILLPKIPVLYPSDTIYENWQFIACNWDVEAAKEQGLELYKEGKDTYFSAKKEGSYALKGTIPGYDKPIIYKYEITDNAWVGKNKDLIIAMANGFNMSVDELYGYNLEKSGYIKLLIDRPVSLEGIEKINVSTIIISYAGGKSYDVDYEALKKCKNLRWLRLDEVPVSELSKFPMLPQIEILGASSPQFELVLEEGYDGMKSYYNCDDYNFLSNFPGLTKLGFANVSARDRRALIPFLERPGFVFNENLTEIGFGPLDIDPAGNAARSQSTNPK